MRSIWQSSSPLVKTIATCTAVELLLFLALLAVTRSGMAAATCVVGLGPLSLVIGPRLFKRFKASATAQRIARA